MVKTKTIVVEEEIWFKLRKLERFPDRSKVNDVVKFLLDNYKKKEIDVNESK